MIAILCVNIDAGGGVESVSRRLDTEFNTNGIASKIYSLKTAKSCSTAFAFNFNSKELSEQNIEIIYQTLKNDGVTHAIVQLNNPFPACLLANIQLFKKLSSIFKVYTVIHSSPLSFLKRYRLFCANSLMFRLKWIKTKFLTAPQAKNFIKQCGKYSVLVSLSQGNKRELSHFYKVNSVLIPNLFKYQVSDETVGREKEHVIAYLGRIDYESKNFKLLLDAWSRVRCKKDWILKIVGPGDKTLLEKYILRKKIKQIALLDGISTEAVKRFLKSISIFVLTSYHEGFPTVLVEAASQGNALISTKHDGFSDEIVKDSVNGYVVNFSVCELEKKIQLLIEDEPLRISMQKESLNIVRKYLTDCNSIEGWKSIF